MKCRVEPLHGGFSAVLAWSAVEGSALADSGRAAPAKVHGFLVVILNSIMVPYRN